MPVELRKRKAPESAPAPPAKKKNAASKVVAKVKEAVTSSTKATEPNGSQSTGKIKVGDIIDLEGFGGEIQTNAGVKTSLKKLVDESKAGVVLFTYPKASTPGCTNQVCLFRDSYEPLTATGFSIFGLSKDSTEANTKFKEKQNLPYPLLCDVSGSLILAIGLKKAPNGTVRGVFIINKIGKILAAEQGSPAGTVAVAKRLVESSGGVATAPTDEPTEETKTGEVVPAPNGINGAHEDGVKTDVAAEVPDTAEKIDSSEAKADVTL